MSPLVIQRLIASVFFVLGGWLLLAPASVIELAVREGWRTDDPLAVFAMGCFGAQACISGLFAWFARFTRTTFLAYGIALIPFFAFNYYFYAVVPLLNEVGLLDLVGNVVMLTLCWMGWKRAPAR
ncbi:hypothetical protein [Sphingomicrobium arenosum]|uniref:hypothetical protein n=1 Tax=Sphingomicrobium arenosum TaxID=2233861 RepID=UPI002240E926|nr:hypothetical protein [Sphingomicrobium arenosum]